MPNSNLSSLPEPGHDQRLVPLAIGAWAGAAVGVGGSGWHVPVWGTLWLVVLAIAWRRWRWVAAGAVAALLFLTGALLLSQQRMSSDLARYANSGAYATVEFHVVSEPTPQQPRPPFPASTKAHVEILSVTARGNTTRQRLPATAIASGDAMKELMEAQLGGSYVATGRLTEAEHGGSVVALLRVRELRQTEPPGVLSRVAGGMREGLRRSMEWSPQTQRALVPSLVVGDTSRISKGLSDDFQDTGLTHLMAVSGANLALMLGVVLGAMRWIGVRGWMVRIAAVGGIGMFILVCGPEPSVLRAAVMGIVALASIGAGKGRRSLRALSVAVVVLMMADPWLSRAPGFWLSVAACLAIVVLGPTFIVALTRWAPRWVAEGVAVPLAAQLGTQPIVTWLSGDVSLVSVFANVLAGPFVGPTTVLGFAAACVSFFPPLSSFLGFLAGWCAQPILWVAHFGAGLPASTIEWIPGAGGIALVALLCAAFAVLAPLVLRRVLTAGLVFLAAGVVVFARPLTPGWPGDWQVAFCDVGQGDATVLNAGSGAAVLIDAGPEGKPVTQCLRALGVQKLPLIVVTHNHSDHVGGLEETAATFDVGMVLVNATAQLERYQRALPDGTRVGRALPGTIIRVGDARWHTLAVHEPGAVSDFEEESAAENDASIVGVGESKGLRVLIAGDAEPEGQRLALEQASPEMFCAQILKLPHHGSSRQLPEFFAASQASMAVASAGEDNSYGHPSAQALDLAREHGMRIARTDTEGSIAVAVEDDTLVVTRGG